MRFSKCLTPSDLVLSVREIHRKGLRCPRCRTFVITPLMSSGGRPYIDRTSENGPPPARYLSLSPTLLCVERRILFVRTCYATRVKSRSLNKLRISRVQFGVLRRETLEGVKWVRRQWKTVCKAAIRCPYLLHAQPYWSAITDSRTSRKGF